jgi:hypothetical protein
MESSKISALLLKYEEGLTTLEEEKFLQDFFTSQEIPNHLKEYQRIFAFTAQAKKESYSRPVKVKSHKYKLAFVGIAASVILAAGIFTTLDNKQSNLNAQNLGTIEDPEEAFLKTKEALRMVSEVFNTGQQELIYVEEFDKNKNRYLKQ